MTTIDQELRCVIADLCEQMRERDAEIERLRAMLDAAQEGGKCYSLIIKRLRDENAKLRAALEQIGDTACGEASHQYIALKALAAMREGK